MPQRIPSDRRQGARYSMKIPIRVAAVGIGSTVDVSATGVAFYIDAPLAPGTVIDFALSVEENGGTVVLQCGGTVVRSERRGASNFAAATIEELVLHQTDARQVSPFSWA